MSSFKGSNSRSVFRYSNRTSCLYGSKDEFYFVLNSPLKENKVNKIGTALKLFCDCWDFECGSAYHFNGIRGKNFVRRDSPQFAVKETQEE